jgi:phosphoribosylanthranilate isomerase
VAAVRETFPDGLRLIAAGGLTPENVEEAVLRLAPDVVDVSSGVEERPGIKSPEKVRAFVRNARRAR